MSKNIKQLQSELGSLVNEFDRLKKTQKKEATPKSKPLKKSKKNTKKINDDFFKISKLSQDKNAKNKTQKKPQPSKINLSKDLEIQELLGSFELTLDENSVIKDINSIKTSNPKNSKVLNDNLTVSSANDSKTKATQEISDYSYLTIKEKLELINKGIQNKKEAIKKIEFESEQIKPIESKSTSNEKTQIDTKVSKTSSSINSKTSEPPNKKYKASTISNKPTAKKTVKTTQKTLSKSLIDVSNKLTLTIIFLSIIAIFLIWYNFLK